MKYILLILGISFYMEGLISNFIFLYTKLWNPLLSLVTLVAIYPFFKNKKRYFQVCLGYGIFYDLVYTDTLVFHGFLFLCIGYLAHYLYKLFSLNVANTILLAFISISAYRILSYSLLCLVGNYQFTWMALLHSITSSLVLNIVYMTLLYVFFKPRYPYINI